MSIESAEDFAARIVPVPNALGVRDMVTSVVRLRDGQLAVAMLEAVTRSANPIAAIADLARKIGGAS